MAKQIVVNPYLFEDVHTGDIVIFLGHPDSDSYLYIDKAEVFGRQEYRIGPGEVLPLRVKDPEEFHWMVEPRPCEVAMLSFNGSGGRYP